MVEGFCAPRFGRVREEFERNLAERGELGASVCVIVDGEPVADLWGGIANQATAARWNRDTTNAIMSCSKGVTALCVHMLADRGLIEFDAPVTRYWPGFGRGGKDGITVRMVLTHQSGVYHVDSEIPDGGLYDWDAMVARVENTRPFWKPGSQVGYHALTIGWILGELVRRVTGSSIGTFVEHEIREPLGLALWLGLPEEQEPNVAPSIGFLAQEPVMRCATLAAYQRSSRCRAEVMT